MSRVLILLWSILASGLAAQAAELPPPGAGQAEATFAGGCFWCMEPPFEKLAGVVSVTSGYTGGTKVDPTYEEVSSGVTGHAEAVRVVYDPAVVTYEKLLEVFWHNVDPLTPNRQFCDAGTQYRSAIFFHGEAQADAAKASKAAPAATAALARLSCRIVPRPEPAVLSLLTAPSALATSVRNFFSPLSNPLASRSNSVVILLAMNHRLSRRRNTCGWCAVAL
jgi:peptide-methionine (S)-S-oxide reductase